ncbi:MAG: fibronectin type III domain-containing protein, partial [Bacteroidota bacterium]
QISKSYDKEWPCFQYHCITDTSNQQLVAFADNPQKAPRRQVDTSNPLFPSGLLPDRITRNAAENPATQLVFTWRMNNSVEEGYVEYLEATDSLNFKDQISIQNAVLNPVPFEGITDHYFRVNIENLKPNTSYQVRVGGKEYRSEWFHVRTAPQEFEPWHFIHFGGVQHFILEYDSRIYSEAATRFPHAQFMMHSGDLVQARGGDDDWGEFFYSGRQIFNKFPMLPAAGSSDHWERKTADSAYRVLFPQWHGIFSTPSIPPPSLKNLAYYVDYPQVRIITLYSGLEASKDYRPTYISDTLPVSEEIFMQQMEWLDNVLAQSPQKWNIVQMHHPVLSAREGRSYPSHEEVLRPILEKHRVGLVLQSHEHLFARGISSTSDLPVYVTTPSGSRTKDWDRDAQWVQKAITQMQLYLVIFVEYDRLKVQTYSLSGNIVDEFYISD